MSIKLTNEEAIDCLEAIRQDGMGYGISEEKIATALNMAIAALKDARPKGKWIVDERMVFPKCSCCKVQGYNSFDFCPMCGADMREGDTE